MHHSGNNIVGTRLKRVSYTVQLFLLIFLISSSQYVFSQQKYTISGYVKDANTGEATIGASVYLKELMEGTPANTYGFYSITAKKGKYTLVVSYVGYQEYTKEIDLDRNIKLNIELKPTIELKEVKVVAEGTKANVQGVEMGVHKMDIKTVNKLPAFMGEKDVMKTLKLLPGVQSVGGVNGGFYVRGGGPGQNLILLDGVPLYNVSHLFGFFSVFNADAVKNVKLIKGGMPAKYGGRLASVVDVTMKEGNMKKYKFDGGIGVIDSRITIQGPIVKDTSSFVVSARRTYAGELAQPFIKESSAFKGSNYYFYDLNAKVNYILSDKDRIFLSGYFGRDALKFTNKKDGIDMNFPWGNAIAAFRWNHLFSDKLFLNTTAYFTNYTSKVGITQSDFEFELYSGIRDYGLKADFTYLPSNLHKIKFGLDYTYHTFIPSNASAKTGEVQFNTSDITKIYANDFAAYISDEWKVTEKLSANIGLRLSAFQQIGPFKRYVKDALGNTTDTLNFKTWENVILYPRAVPRISLRYLINEKSSIKASYAQNYQYIHLTSIASVALPTDVWVPSSKNVKPQFSSQYALGYFRNFNDNKWVSSLQVYYKDMKHQIEFKDGTLPESSVGQNVDENFTFGNGNSYGAELYIKKAYGNFNGWLGYTLSWTNKNFPQLNKGVTFPAKYDRRHDVSMALTYELGKRWTFGAIFIYATGNALTVPVSRYTINGYLITEYGKRNGYRMKPYNRLDLSVTLKGNPDKKVKSSWNLSIYNVYNRHNPYFIYYSNEGDLLKGTLDIHAKQVSLFGILPSITWNFEF